MMDDSSIDPVWLVRGKRMSEHQCLYCCLCFVTLTVEECAINAQGIKEDVCQQCADMEKAIQPKQNE